MASKASNYAALGIPHSLKDVVSRTTPALWEWLCGISLIAWGFAHSLILGKE